VRRIGRAEIAVATSLLAVYLATLAPGVTLWDSGEFLAAIHSLGIPHPPGTPLYILIANVWTKLFAPVVGFAYSVNVLSAACAAAAMALLANLFVRATGDRAGACAAALCAGAMSTLWSSATETEVYSSALLFACAIIWLGNTAGDTGDRRWLVLGAYVAGLGLALHLTALLTVPAALYLAFTYNRSSRTATRSSPRASVGIRGFRIVDIASPLIAFALGASVILFLLLRARNDPAVNQGNPSHVAALTDVLLRQQYKVAPLWPRQAPWFIQFGNLFEYADWQVALGLSPDPPPSWVRTPLTVVYGLLGILGAHQHRRLDRRSWRGLVILFVTATLGVLAYLNLKAGASYGAGFLPAGAPHEARERDYFFMLAFVCWGLWAGFGSVHAMRWLRSQLRLRAPEKPSFETSHVIVRSITNWLPFAGILMAAAPIALNWSAVNRRAEPGASEARHDGMRILGSAPANSVVLAHGDNETYPVWYLQEVEHVRDDVTLVVVPLLPAQWYRAELMRRGNLLTTDFVEKWRGSPETILALCEGAARRNRPIGDASYVAGDKFPAKCANP
jgi:hypothetical protein